MGFAIFPRTPQAIFPTRKSINGSKIRKKTSSFESIVNVIAYVIRDNPNWNVILAPV